MPNIRSARKKLRKDTKREAANVSYKNTVKKTVKNMSKINGKEKSAEEISKAFSIIDKAAKKKLIHPNKAARLKSQISRVNKSA
jgi:small subunit ribosomal protein S20